jgi:hypothetical protein
MPEEDITILWNELPSPSMVPVQASSDVARKNMLPSKDRILSGMIVGVCTGHKPETGVGRFACTAGINGTNRSAAMHTMSGVNNIFLTFFTSLQVHQ